MYELTHVDMECNPDEVSGGWLMKDTRVSLKELPENAEEFELSVIGERDTKG